MAELNRRAREAWRSLGRLGTDELVAPGGAQYATGDRVVALAPGAAGSVVTSETGTVLALDAKARALVARMDDDGGDLRRLDAEEIAGDRLAHSYAVTCIEARARRWVGLTPSRTAADGSWPM